MGHSTAHWLGGSSNVWVFLRENVGPFPSSAVSNYRTNSNVTWEFNIYDTTLRFTDSRYESDEGETVEVRNLPWLSAKIVYDDRGEYDIDNFGTNFQIIAPQHVNPTPKLLLSCWSIWSKQWLLPGQSARFVIINRDGEEESFSIYVRPGIEVDRWGVLFDAEEVSEYEESECGESAGNNDADDEEEATEDEATEADEADEATEAEVKASTDLVEDVRCEEISL